MLKYTKKLKYGWTESDVEPILKEYKKIHKDAILAVDHCTDKEIFLALRTGPGGQKLNARPAMVNAKGFKIYQEACFIVAEKVKEAPAKKAAPQVEEKEKPKSAPILTTKKKKEEIQEKE